MQSGLIGRGAETAPVYLPPTHPGLRRCPLRPQSGRGASGPSPRSSARIGGVGEFAEAQAASPRPWTEKTREGGGEAVERSRGGGREGHRIRSLGCGRGEGRKGSPRSIRSPKSWRLASRAKHGGGKGGGEGCPDLFSSPFLEHLAPGFPPGGSERQSPPPPPQLLPHPTMR